MFTFTQYKYLTNMVIGNNLVISILVVVVVVLVDI